MPPGASLSPTLLSSLGTCNKPTILASSLFPPSQAHLGRSHTRTTTPELSLLSALPGRLEVPGGMACLHRVSPRMPVVLHTQPTLAYLAFCVTSCQSVPPSWRQCAGCWADPGQHRPKTFLVLLACVEQVSSAAGNLWLFLIQVSALFCRTLASLPSESCRSHIHHFQNLAHVTAH